MFHIQDQRGVAIILALMVMSGILGMVLGLSATIVSEIQFNRSVGFSVPALYAADSGIEKVLVNRDSPADISQTTLSNGATFEVVVTAGGLGSCAAASYCIISTGMFQDARRAIEITA